MVATSRLVGDETRRVQARELEGQGIQKLSWESESSRYWEDSTNGKRASHRARCSEVSRDDVKPCPAFPLPSKCVLVYG